MNLDVLQLLRQEQADNRQQFANQRKAQQEAAENQQTWSGTYLGTNAEQQVVVVVLDNGTELPCQSITSGSIKPGQRVQVTLPPGAAIGFVDAMPR